MSEPAQLALVVSHTHWDREWYKTAEAFRIGLVRLIDELLDRNAGEPFLLDGQAIVLEDYASDEPEDGLSRSEAALRRMLASAPARRAVRSSPPGARRVKSDEARHLARVPSKSAQSDRPVADANSRGGES